MKRIILSLVLIFLIKNLFGQSPEISFNEITLRDGLTYDYIHCICQDRNGFIWVGSRLGFQRFDGYNFKTYLNIPGDTNSLSSNSVNSIAEDSRGLLWIGTNYGLNVFDPEAEQFIQYYGKSWNSRIAAISTVFIDHKENIWLKHLGRLVKISEKEFNTSLTKEFIIKNGVGTCFEITDYYLYDAKEVPLFYQAGAIYEDSKNKLWIGGNGLYILHRENDKFYRLDSGPDHVSRLTSPNVTSILEENMDNFWIGTHHGLNKLENVSSALSDSIPDKSKLSIIHHFPNKGSGSNIIVDMHKDRYRNIWLGIVGEEISRLGYDDKGNVNFESFKHDVSDVRNTGYAYITSIFEDRTGVIWLGHPHYGISTFSSRVFQFTSCEKFRAEDLNAYDINPVYEDKAGDLWIADFLKDLYKINRSTGRITNYRLGTPIYKILERSDGLFWIGTMEQGLFTFDPLAGTFHQVNAKNDTAGLLKSIWVKTLLEDENHLFAGSNSNGLLIYNTLTNELRQYKHDYWDSLSIKNNSILSVCKIKKGDYWILTIHGLNRLQYDHVKGNARFMIPPENISGTDNNYLSHVAHTMHTGDNGFIWIGSLRGLFRYDPETGGIISYRNTSRLSVYSIQEDKNQNLWMGTGMGLHRFNKITGEITEFSLHDGVPIIKHSNVGSFKNKDGKMYFSGIGGIYSFHPDSIQINDHIPEVMITDFKLNNQSVSVNTSIKSGLSKNISYMDKLYLRYDQNDISFEFAALDYSNVSKNRYAYKLEGYQDEWIHTDAKNRLAQYTNLDPGRYIFRVKGSNNNGIWNEEGASLSMIIRPPWWKTAIAYISYIILIFLLIYGFVKWRTWRLRHEKEVLEKEVEERTHQLKEHEEELIQQKEELQQTLDYLKETQAQLVQSEKMASIGQLTAGIAHEINNPVNYINAGIDSLSTNLAEIDQVLDLYQEITPENSEEKLLKIKEVKEQIEYNQARGEIKQLVESIKKGSERTTEIVKGLRTFSRLDENELKKADLQEGIDLTLMMLQNKYKHHVQIVKEYGDIPFIECYPGKINQVFMNILSNAIDAIQEKGVITIKTFKHPENGMVCISIKDTGEGISEYDKTKIFDPFFTTKDVGKGTGLGLSISHGIVEQHNGTIEVEGVPGEGAEFVISLPLKK